MPKNYIEILQNCRIDNNTVIKIDHLYLTINNNVIGTGGNFVSFTGLPKSSKSTFICGVIASCIARTQIFGFNCLTYPHLNKTRIALFDTEQSNFDFQRKAKIIKKLAKVENIYNVFDAFTVTEHSTTTILHLIKTYLQNTPDIAVIIIDGLLDLIDNFNDERASKNLIKILRSWAKKYDILIITVLHLGKKDNMALGHLGSTSSRYCQSELEIAKTKNNTYTLTPKMLRSAGNFEPVEIMYSEIEKSFIQI